MKKVFSIRLEEKVIEDLKKNYGKSLTQMLDIYLSGMVGNKECPTCKQTIRKKVANG